MQDFPSSDPQQLYSSPALLSVWHLAALPMTLRLVYCFIAISTHTHTHTLLQVLKQAIHFAVALVTPPHPCPPDTL